MTIYEIWCHAIEDNDTLIGTHFSVSADSTNTIEDLKWMVKDKMKPRFDNVSIIRLELWKVITRVSHKTSKAALKSEITKLNIPHHNSEEDSTHDVQELNPCEELSHCWETAPEENYLHVIVRALPELGIGISTSTSGDSRHSARLDELRVVYNNSWGKRWSTRKETITSDSTSTTFSDDMTDVDMIPANDICPCSNDNGPTQQTSLPWEYTCLDNIRLLDRAFRIPTEVPDIIVVRDEYITLREALEARKGSIILTGQPGIGKSMFLIYLLLHRLEKKLPTAVQFVPDHYVLFDESGVKVHGKNNSSTLSDSCWALTDSNSDVKEPCPAFQASHARIIQATPPEVERWKDWSKYAKGDCSVMIVDLPKPHEIAAIAQEMYHDPSTAITLMESWGPCIRTIVKILRNPPSADEHRKEVTGAGLRLGIQDSVFHTDYISDLDSLSSPILFIYPIRNSKPCFKLGRYIPTAELLKIYDRICERIPDKAALNLIEMLSMHSLTRNFPVWHHEKWMHFAMTYASHSLEVVRRDRSVTMYKKLGPTRELLPLTLCALKRGLMTDNRKFYWFPPNENFEGIDGVLVEPRDIFVLQATIAGNDRSPVNGLRKLWSLLGPNPKQLRQWHFVTVVADEYLATRYTTSFEKDLAVLYLGKDQIRVWGGVLPTTM